MIVRQGDRYFLVHGGMRMDTRSGDLYPNVAAAKRAGVPPRYIVEVKGPVDAVKSLAKKVQKQAAHERHLRRQRRKARRGF